MFCDLCARQLEPAARFCDLCGRQLELPATLCESCRRELEPGASFCDACGQKLAVEEADQQAYAPVMYSPPPPRVEFEETPILPPPMAAPQRPPSYETVLGRPMSRPSIPYAALFEQAPPPPRAAAKPQPPRLYEIVLGDATVRPSSEAGEAPAVGEKRAEPVAELKPAEPSPPSQPGKARRRPIRIGRLPMTRRALMLSLAGVAVIVIVAFAFLGGAIMLPPLSGTAAQTTSQTVTTQATGPPLQVEINIASNPISPGSTQVIVITVQDPSGAAVSDASVRVQVLPPSGNNVTSEGVTNADGQYSYSWEIPSSEKIGEFQVKVTATKAGYSLGQAKATFLVWL